MQNRKDVAIRILLVFRTFEPRVMVRAILENTYSGQVDITEIPLIQDAIDHLEKKEANYDLIFFEHDSTAQALIKTFFTLGGQAQFIMCSSDEKYFDNFRDLPVKVEFMLTREIEGSFYRVLKKFSASGKLPRLPAQSDELFVTVNPQTLLGTTPLKSDIFVLMGSRYVLIFRAGDELEQADLQKYLDKKIVALFYMKKSDCVDVLKVHAANIEKATEKKVVTTEEAEDVFNSSSDLVRDLVGQIGFTAETQEVAKNTVSMMVKSLGSSPKLSNILKDLKKKDGGYISSHSFMVGQVACAIAHRIGWNSAGTYQKLVFASFLHDIALNYPELAQIHSFEEAKSSGKYTPEELQLLKTHPLKSADYSKQFSELPADVDVIVAQHHERPDGTGFPRELGSKGIAPLAALFIIAHDLVNDSHDQPDITVESFIKEHAGQYESGQFKKIYAALSSADAKA